MKTQRMNLENNQERTISERVPRWIIALLFLIPVLIYLPGIIGKIPFPSDSSLYTDLMLTHYPNALYLKKSIIEFLQIPLWSTFIHSGAPFAANPLSGIFYLPGWLALLFPLPGGLSILMAAHAVFASWGMYLFLKTEKIGEMGAIAGGLIFGLMPKIAAHYGAGHVSMIYAISWTPWLLLVSKSDRRGWKTGITGALLFLADPRWSVYAGIFWFSFDVAYRQSLGIKKTVLYYIRAAITALLIASPLIIPMYEYVGLSTRSRMGLDDVLTFSLSPERIIGVIVPGSWGNPEWYFYAGGIVLGLFLIQFLFKETRRKNRFWNIWIIVSIVISFGSWFINPEWIIKIPVISLLRVPARALFLLGFSFSVVAARSIENLIVTNRKSKNINRAAFALALFSLGLSLPIAYLVNEFSIGMIWGFGFLFVFSVFVLIWKHENRSRLWGWIIIGFLVIDLLGAGLQSFYLAEDDPEKFAETMSFLNEDPEIFRVYSPSFSVPQRFASEYGFELVDGVDPMQVAEYADFMEGATGIEYNGYGVTIPAFATGNPAVDNIGSEPNAYLLSLINVKYVISEFPLENPDLQELNNNDGNYIYRNTIVSQRAWIERSHQNNLDDQAKSVESIQELTLSPNRITLSASGPGKLILSEINYPGWKVFVDEEKKSIEQAYGLLRSVNLPEGKHKVEFIFRPVTVYFGIGLAVLGWLLSLSQAYINKADDGILQ